MTPRWLITQDLNIEVQDSQQSALVKNVIASHLTIKQQLANGDYKVKANVWKGTIHNRLKFYRGGSFEIELEIVSVIKMNEAICRSHIYLRYA